MDDVAGSFVVDDESHSFEQRLARAVDLLESHDSN